MDDIVINTRIDNYLKNNSLTDTRTAKIVRHAHKRPFYGHALYPTFNARSQEQIATSFI